VTGDDRAIEVEDVPPPSGGPAEQRVFVAENSAVLVYRAAENTGGGVAVLRFLPPVAVFHGVPNDEALVNHPLWGRGLGFYGVYRIEDSTWKAQMQDRGARRDRPRSPVWSDLTHYVVTMHDSTFECLARDMTGELRFETIADVVAEVARALGQPHDAA
jgi:hypothetical protein